MKVEVLPGVPPIGSLAYVLASKALEVLFGKKAKVSININRIVRECPVLPKTKRAGVLYTLPASILKRGQQEMRLTLSMVISQDGTVSVAVVGHGIMLIGEWNENCINLRIGTYTKIRTE